MKEHRDAGIKEYKTKPITPINYQLLTINYCAKRTHFPHFLSTIHYELSTGFEKRTQFNYSRSLLLHHPVRSRTRNADMRPTKRTQFPKSSHPFQGGVPRSGEGVLSSIAAGDSTLLPFAFYPLPFFQNEPNSEKQTQFDQSTICNFQSTIEKTNPMNRIFNSKTGFAKNVYLYSCILVFLHSCIPAFTKQTQFPDSVNLQFTLYNLKFQSDNYGV
jgi:hypothetical protein